MENGPFEDEFPSIDIRILPWRTHLPAKMYTSSSFSGDGMSKLHFIGSRGVFLQEPIPLMFHRFFATSQRTETGETGGSDFTHAMLKPPRADARSQVVVRLLRLFQVILGVCISIEETDVSWNMYFFEYFYKSFTYLLVSRYLCMQTSLY